MSTKHYVASLADGTSHFYDMEDEPRIVGRRYGVDSAHEEAGRTLLHKAKLTTSRRNPQSVEIKISQITLVEGQPKRTPVKTIKLTPSLVRMTKEEYEEELDACIKQLPDDFRSFVVAQAWDRGHSAGYEEVIGHAAELADTLSPVIRKYTQALKGLV